MVRLFKAITAGNDLKELKSENSQKFKFIRDTKISYFIPQNSFFCVNNSFVKILKPSRSHPGFDPTVAYREYIQLPDCLEMVIEVESLEVKNYLQKYLHLINYFGKRGCFFQFIEYSDEPSEPNVHDFKPSNQQPGILQQYDDFPESATFDQVNNFSNSKIARKREIMVLPIHSISSSKSFTAYKL